MKVKNVFLFFLTASLLLFSDGCKKQPVTSVISADGVRIVFDQKGNGKPAIIFVHGWSNNKIIWDAQVTHFSEKYKAIAVDLAGCGESGNNRTKWTMSAFGDDVAAIINKLKLKKVVLVGFSMGAPVVVEAAAKMPENIAGVVLVDDLLNIETKYSPEMIHYIDSLMMDLITNPTNEKLVNNGFYKKNPEEEFQRVLAMLKGNISKTGLEESINDYFKWVNEDCPATLKLVKAPVVAINSDSEPTNVEAFRKYVPSFQAKIVPGVGHLIFWDEPDEFNRLLEESIQGFINNQNK
jgi:pimeloyl-ACP methyl ester carboxylesterase